MTMLSLCMDCEYFIGKNKDGKLICHKFPQEIPIAVLFDGSGKMCKNNKEQIPAPKKD